jgi:hypothetical protein
MSVLKHNIRVISQELLDKLLVFRSGKVGFTFSLRERDSVQSEESRLEAGQWFQGSDYIFVPLFRRGDSARKIKTIGFVITFTDDGEIEDNYIEVSFKGGVDASAEVDFHKELAQHLHIPLNNYNFGSHSYSDPENYLGNLDDYLNRVFPLAIQLLSKYNLAEKYVVPEDKFVKNLNRINQIKSSFLQSQIPTVANIPSVTSNTNNASVNPLNSILYGPPGTGKTYNTVIKALSILEETSEEELRKEERKHLKGRFGKYIDEERIAFITFHQNVSYEDFIEGIKPEFDQLSNQLIYPTKPGLFKQVCLNAIKSLYRENKQEDEAIEFDDFFELFVQNLKQNFQEGDFQFVTKEGSRLRVGKDEIYDDRLTVYYEWSNSVSKQQPGKTPFSIKKSILEKMFFGGVTDTETNLRARLLPYTTYHLSPYYAVYKSIYAFINQKLAASDGKLKERLTEVIDEEISYESYIEKLQKVAGQKEILIQGKPYVLIIDEINRGNVSQIFGELITLLEHDKRLGNSEALIVKLPYSKTNFGVPCNLYLIGTMNTADRSVEALDTALRRRFSFEEMMPISSKLEATTDGIDLPKMLEAMNERLEVLLDRDHTIGHAWLMGCKDAHAVKRSFEDKIIPLLKEFFYNDYSKIGLVIGEDFFEKDGVKQINQFASFARIDHETRKELSAKPIFRTKMPTEPELVKAFQSIYLGNQPTNAEANQGL